MKENRLPYGKNAGFKIPEGYFQDFETRMMAKVAAPENKPEVNPFKVPEGYFEQLEEKVFERLEQAPKEIKVISLFNRRTLSYIAGIAAVLAVLLTSVVFNNPAESGFQDLEMAAVENYLLESLDFDNPNNTAVEEYNFTATANPEIDKEALFEYLNDHIEEPALLLNDD